METYGWTDDQARGQSTHTLLQTHFPIPLEEIEAALADAGAWDGELAHARQDGARIVVESRQVLVRDVQGTPTATLEINCDITQRKQVGL